jgi:endonuclease/exonuclease/phosphatase family metal-dependent hydrolase
VDLFIAAELPDVAPDLTRSLFARLGYTAFRPGMVIEEIASYPSGVALRVRLSGKSRDITVVGVHLPSRLYQLNEEDQRLAADTCHSFVEDQEQPLTPREVGHDRTIVIGDFNLDPYSPAMVGIAGFNAMMTPRPTRRVAGRSRATFYNPMWNEFGDRSGSPGTYYLGSPRALGYFWHMLDQVLIRPSRVDHIESVHVIDDVALVSPRARRPLRSVSDHLPIELTLSARAFGDEETT